MVDNSVVILLFGASGSGKSTLMEQLLSLGGQYSVHFKGTDRPRRQYDSVEIVHDPDLGPEKYDYIYQTYGHRYGIQRSQIDEAISRKRHHFIICNDISTIQDIKRDYGDLVRVVFHYFDAPREELLRIQGEKRILDDEMDLRLTKTEVLYRQFVEEWALFDATLCNRLGEDPLVLRKRMENLLSEFAANARDAGMSSAVMQRLNAFAQDLERKVPSSSSGRTTEKNYVFIIMAMKDDADTQDTHHTVKRVCKDLGFRADRVDDIQFTGEITEKIQGSIEIAEFIIADLSHARPNVYYEIGYADACGKPLILVARKRTKVHFDLQGQKVLFYRNMCQLESLLTQALSALKRSEDHST